MRDKIVLGAIRAILALSLVAAFSGCERLGEGPSGTGGPGAVGPGHFESSILPVGDSPVWGNYQAPVTVALFADFNLPESLQVARMVNEVVADERLADKVRLVIKAVPGRGDIGEPLIHAMLFADQNGSFWGGFYDRLIESGGNLTEESLRDLVVQSGLDGEQYDQILEEGWYYPVIEANRMLARTLRTGRTSSVLVNGTLLRDVTADQLRSTVAGELEAVEEMQQSGISAGQIYARRVLENAPVIDRRDFRGRRDREGRPDRPGIREGLELPEGSGREPVQRPEPAAAPTPEQVAQRIAAATPSADDVERMNIPIGDSYTRGPADAPVTIVAFNDFHCPYSRRGNETVEQLLSAYGDYIRVVFKNNPLPMHPEAPLAHQAALAAGAQGKFWEMHDLIFADSQARSREDLEGFAAQIGLDMDQFRAYLDGNQGNAAIEADQQVANRAAARGTPHFFINGRRLRGAQPIERFMDVIDSEIALANQLTAQGTARDQVFDAIMARAQALPEQAAVEAEQPPPAPTRTREERLAAATPPPEGTERMRVPIGDSPINGPEDALVTIVEFSDFHCPYSRRGTDTIDQIRQEYGSDIRLVFKNNPLPMHPDSPLAHQAALAAGAQGKFWEMHHLIFANAQARTRADLEGFAQQLGLDMDAFRAYLDQGTGNAQITADQDLARQVGARGTPHFFINGRRLRGAQPIDRFYDVIDSEIALANQLQQQGVARNQLYDHLMASALEAPAPEPAEPPSIAEMPPIGDSPVLGPADAPVTIFMYDEFQCPYCRRAEDTLRQVREQYGERVRFVWRDYPLPFHSNANIAAQAAHAAGEQGKFWEYHDVLFQNQRNMTRPDLERYAEELGLDMAQFREALDNGRHTARIESGLQEGQRMGVSGTPTFFINGERLVGAVPFSEFQSIIDRQLQR